MNSRISKHDPLPLKLASVEGALRVRAVFQMELGPFENAGLLKGYGCGVSATGWDARGLWGLTCVEARLRGQKRIKVW